MMPSFNGKLIQCWMALTGCVLAAPVHAQTTSGAGSATFVTSYKMIGADALPGGVLEPWLADHVMQSKTLLELRQLAAELEKKLQTEQGLVSPKVWVPLLENNLGEVPIRVLPGMIRGVRFEQPITTRKERRALVLLTSQLQPGALLLKTSLETTARALADILGVPPKLSLVPTATLGQYDVVVSLPKVDTYSLTTGLDNVGSRYTNTWRDKTQLQIRNPLGSGDTLAIAGQLATPNQKVAQIHYETPIGSSGYQLGLTSIASSYHLVDAYASLDAVGDTHVVGVDLSRGLIRSQSLHITARAEAQKKSVRSLQAGVPITHRKIQTVNAGLFLNAPTLGGTTAASWVVTSGNVDMSQVVNDVLSDAAGIGGGYQKMTLHLEQSAALSADRRLQVNLHVQRARKNLDATESMLIGGPSGVRAYGLGEGASDSGATLNVELHQRWSEQWRGFVFYDHGWASLRQLPIAGSTSVNAYDLNGIGLSAVWTPTARTQVALMPTWKLKLNPNISSTTGTDADGSGRAMRVWLFVTQTF